MYSLTSCLAVLDYCQFIVLQIAPAYSVVTIIIALNEAQIQISFVIFGFMTMSLHSKPKETAQATCYSDIIFKNPTANLYSM